MPDAVLSPAVGVGVVGMADASLINIPRTFYVYENRGIEPQSVAARTLYVYENKGVSVVLAARALYLYENRGIQSLEVLARALDLFENLRDGEVFPWLEKLLPAEQYRGGQVDLYGDGLGEVREVAADATITVSSSVGGNIGSNTVDRTTSEWQSAETTTDAWIRYTFAAPRVLVGCALEGRLTQVGLAPWGNPTFRFGDAGSDVVGAPGPALSLAAESTAEYPVATRRSFYAFPAPRTSNFLEIRSTNNNPANGGRGLREVWIYEDADQAAETSSAILNEGLPEEGAMGIVLWSGRSPGLWPSNAEMPTQKAVTVTVPVDAVSGLVRVRETT
jgi:hypothetical protein